VEGDRDRLVSEAGWIVNVALMLPPA
jgi:hypothetical protein